MATLPIPQPQQPAPAAAAPRQDTRFEALLREAGEVTVFAGRAARALPGAFTYFSEVLRQAAMMVTGTAVVLFLMEMFQGAAVANAGFFLLRAIGAGDFFGLLSGYGVPRFTGLMMFGYVFASKICCGMAAQLGAMKIQQEVDALESTGVDSLAYLVGTRILATVLFLPAAFVIAYFGDMLGAYTIAVVMAKGLSSTTFFSVHWSVQSLNDLLYMAGVMGVIGLFSATVACFYGLRTKGGPAAVGSSVARSLLVNLTAVHVIGACGAALMYGIDQHLPIGG
jgi:phospholipid/cholesterol/gamma-HCH transport system permease protein